MDKQNGCNRSHHGTTEYWDKALHFVEYGRDGYRVDCGLDLLATVIHQIAGPDFDFNNTLEAYYFCIHDLNFGVELVTTYNNQRRYKVTIPAEFFLPPGSENMKCKHQHSIMYFDIDKGDDHRIVLMRRLHGILHATCHMKQQVDDKPKARPKRNFKKKAAAVKPSSSEKVAGDAEASSSKQENTIITETQKAPSEPAKPPSKAKACGEYSSTEKSHTFKTVTDRWVPLKAFTIDSTYNAFDRIVTFDFPKDILADKCVSNLIPFTTFSYGVFIMEVKFTINAQRFQAGLGLVSVTPNPATMPTSSDSSNYANVQSFLLRECAARFDISTQTNVTVKVPFMFHRSTLRTMLGRSPNKGVIPAWQASVNVLMLSKVNVPTGGSQNFVMLPFYRFTEATFYGMGPTKTLGTIKWEDNNKKFVAQSPIGRLADVGDVVVDTGAKFVSFVKELDHNIDRIGTIVGLDKPIDLMGQTVVVPRPRLNFISGVGPSDAIPIRMNPRSSTTYMPHHRERVEVTDIRQLMRKWSYLGSFSWAATSAQGSELYNIAMNPVILSLRETFTGLHPSMLEYLAGMYNFFSGTIEIQIIAVGTSFHSGTLTISAEYDVETTAADFACTYGTYTKTVDIGEQRVAEFTFPYIYDTNMRRMGNCPMTIMYKLEDASYVGNTTAITPRDDGWLRVRVANPLRNAESAASKIEVLLFIRAGEDFQFHSLTSNIKVPAQVGGQNVINNFPADYKHDVLTHTLDILRAKGKREKRELRSITPTPDETEITIDQDAETASHSGWFQAVAPFSYTGDIKHIRRDILAGTSAYDKELTNYKKAKATPRYYWYNPEFNERSQPAKSDAQPKSQALVEAEKLDATADFAPGPNLRKVMTNDNQHNINWILRRPVMFISQQNITRISPAPGLFNVLHVPLMPPQDDLCKPYGGDPGTVKFCAAMMRSPACSLTRLFRMWRGTMRYTIVVHTVDIVYVTVVPHSGARLLGVDMSAIYRIAESGSKKYPGVNPATLGLPTIAITPTINPTETIEVPYDTENEWTLMHEIGDNQNYQWKDKGDFNIGHLLIWSNSDAIVDVFWAAGDDFRMSGFIGLKTMNHNFYSISDNNSGTAPVKHGEIQAQVGAWQLIKQAADKVTEVVEYAAGSPLVTPAAIAAGSLVSPALGTAVSGMVLTRKADVATEKFAKVTDEISSVMMGIRGLVETLDSDLTPKVSGLAVSAKLAADQVVTLTDGTSRALEILREKLSEVADNIIAQSSLKIEDGCKTVILNALFDIFIVLRNRDNIVENLAVAVARLLMNMGLITVGLLAQATKVIRTAYETFMGISIQQQSETGYEAYVPLASLALGALGAILRVTEKLPTDVTLKKWLKMFAVETLEARTWSVINQMTRFISGTLYLFVNAYNWLLGKVDPSVEALRILAERDHEVDLYIQGALKIINPVNKKYYLDTTIGRMALSRTFVSSYQMLGLLSRVETSDSVRSLKTLCLKVIKFAEDNSGAYLSAPVRYEPFVIALEGAPGVGKSYCAESLALEMLQAINYKTNANSVVHVRSPGVAFWNGYNGQPVILYDDFMNLNNKEAAVLQVSELYQLKSTAMMNLNMAALEDKNIMAEPLIVVLCTNDNFNAGDVVYNTAAFRRRRDMVLHVTSDDSRVRENLQGDQQEPNFDHLSFQNYQTITERSSKTTIGITWPEMTKYVRERFARYHQQELVNVRMRINMLNSKLRDETHRVIGFEDPTNMFFRSISLATDEDLNLSMLPSEIIEQQVLAVLENLNQQRQQNQIEIPPEPANPWIIAQMDTNEYVNTIISILETPAIGPMGFVTGEVNDCVRDFLDFIRDWETRLNSLQGERCVVGGNCDNNGVTHCCDSLNGQGRPHYWCQPCHEGMVRASENGVVRCPNCRSPNVSRICDAAGFIPQLFSRVLSMGITSMNLATRLVMVCMTRIARKADLNLYSFLVFGTTSDTIEYSLGVSWLGVAATAGILLTTALADVRRAIPRGTVAGFFSRHRTIFSRSYFTLNKFIEYITQPFRSQAPEDYYINEQLLDEQQQEDREFCPHEQIMHNLEIAAAMDYEQGEMVFTVNMVDQQRVPLTPCTRECVWTRQNQINFYRLWADRRRLILANVPQNMVQAVPPILRTPDMIELTDQEWAMRTRLMTWVAGARDMASSLWACIVEKIGKKTMIVMAGLSMCYLAWDKLMGMVSLISSLWSGEQPVTEIISSGDSVTRHLPRPTHLVRSPTTFQAFAQAARNTNLTGIVSKLLTNYVIVELRTDTRVLRMQALGLCGYHLLIPLHYKQIIERSGGVVTMYRATQMHFKVTAKLDMTDSIRISDTDLVIITVPQRFNQFKDIRKYFAKRADFSSPMETKMFLLDMAPYMGETIVPMMHNVNISTRLTNVTYSGFDGYTTVNIKDALMYDFGMGGACGSVLLRPTSNRPIVAIHVAGTSTSSDGYRNSGYGALVYAEDFDMLNPVPADYQLTAEPVKSNTTMFQEDSNVQLHGSVPPQEVPFQPAKSKIIPSLLAPYLPPPHTETSILSKEDDRWVHSQSPLVSGSAKHGIQVKAFPKELLDEAKQAIGVHLWNTVKPALTPLVKRSVEDAIVGFERQEFYDPLDLSTSVGYPYNLMGYSTKKDLIQVTDDPYPKVARIDPLVLEVMDSKSTQRRQGIRPNSIFQDFLKDERRKPEKARQLGGTRIICMSPIDLTITMRQYFQDFCASFMRSRGPNGSMVGIAPDGPEWTKLVHDLLSVGNNIFTIDYKDFGPAFMREVAEIAFDAIIDWNVHNGEFTQEQIREMRILKEEILASDHICHNLLYRQNCGAPSGSSLTTPLNTLVNFLYVFCAWISLANLTYATRKYASLRHFNEHVVFRGYGDDGILSVSDEVKHWFNGVTVVDFFSKFGIVATGSEKSASIRAFGPIEEAQFLKRGFRKHPDRNQWLAPLSWPSIEDCAKWIWTTPAEDLAAEENAYMSVLLAFGHGKEKFETWKNQVNQALEAAKLNKIALTWEHVDELYFAVNTQALVSFSDPLRTPIVLVSDEDKKKGLQLLRDDNMYWEKTQPATEEMLQLPGQTFLVGQPTR